MSETQPYRLFKNFLDTIIKMPDNLKNELAEIFEKKRLEMQNSPKKDFSFFQEEEEKPEEEEVQEETKQTSIFDNIFSGKEGSELLHSISEKTEQSPTQLLSPANAPQHKCPIREW
jgi:hypothetical protein